MKVFFIFHYLSVKGILMLSIIYVLTPSVNLLVFKFQSIGFEVIQWEMVGGKCDRTTEMNLNPHPVR